MSQDHNEEIKTVPAAPDEANLAERTSAEAALRSAEEAAGAAEAGLPDEPPADEGTDEPKKEGEVLSRKRRTALVAYLSVLFAVAFLLVALSLVVENRHLQTNSEKTSASLNSRITELQNGYNQLSAKSAEQEKKIGELQTLATEWKDSAENLEADLAALTGEKDALQEQLEALGAELEDADARSQDIVRVHELVYEAQAADEEGDMERLQELLDEIEPMKDLLCPTALDLYYSLVIA